MRELYILFLRVLFKFVGMLCLYLTAVYTCTIMHFYLYIYIDNTIPQNYQQDYIYYDESLDHTSPVNSRRLNIQVLYVPVYYA